MTASASPPVIRETRADGDVPLFVHEPWVQRFPWLVAGTTGAGDDDAPFDLGLFGDAPVGRVTARWRELIDRTGMRGAVHARQVHGSEVRPHRAAHDGLRIDQGYDGHATRAVGLLLTVSVADCVPVFLVDPEARAIALLHAGWRGVAADMLERGIEALAAEADSTPERLWMHAGPAICGDCYEVGPEVHEAVGAARPDGNATLDLRAALVRRGRNGGLLEDRISVSAHCTRCGPPQFFSHRGGRRERQMAVLGIRD